MAPLVLPAGGAELSFSELSQRRSRRARADLYDAGVEEEVLRARQLEVEGQALADVVGLVAVAAAAATSHEVR